MMRFLGFLLLPFLATAAWANSYQWKELKPPSADSIIAFSNGKPPATNSRNKKTRGEISAFLSDGVVFFNRQDMVEYLMSNDRRDIQVYDGSMDRCDGVLVDDEGRVYFWSLHSPHVLRLETENTEACYLLLLEPKAEKQPGGEKVE